MNEEVIDPGPMRRSNDTANPVDPITGRCAAIESMQERLQRGDDRMNRIESKLDQTCADMSEVLDILRMGKSFFRLIGYVGSFIKWAAAIAAPVVALYLTLKDGHK